MRSELNELVLQDLNALEEDGERERFFNRHGIEAVRLPKHIRRRRPKPIPSIPAVMWRAGHMGSAAAQIR